MYAEYYGLREKPFAMEPDARFLVLVEQHREALATLVYAMEEREGWALVIGGPGVGKTTLIMALLKELGESVVAGVVTNPRLTPLDLFNQMALELGLDGPFPSKGPFLASLSQLISHCRRVGKQVLLVVDEAQLLTGELLEEIRLLGNLDNGSPRVLSIFLIGQPELIEAMKQGGAQALMQRLHRNYGLKPLSPAETADYIAQRLALAGSRQSPFTAEALAAVHQVSRGIPRLINSVCDGVLILGMARDQTLLGPDLVWEVAREDASLAWPPAQAQESAPPPPPLPLPAVAPAPASSSPPTPAQAKAAATPGAPPAPAPAPPPLEAGPGAPAPAGPPQSPPTLASLGDLLDSLEAPPSPLVDLAPVEEEPLAAPATPQPPPGLAPPRRPLPAAAPAPKRRKESKPPAEAPAQEEAPAGRSKGKLIKRIIILLVALSLAGGGYFVYKRYWHRIAPLLRLRAEVVVPEAPSPPPKGRASQGPADWGPLLRYSPPNGQGQGDDRG